MVLQSRFHVATTANIAQSALHWFFQLIVGDRFQAFLHLVDEDFDGNPLRDWVYIPIAVTVEISAAVFLHLRNVSLSVGDSTGHGHHLVNFVSQLMILCFVCTVDILSRVFDHGMKPLRRGFSTDQRHVIHHSFVVCFAVFFHAVKLRSLGCVRLTDLCQIA